MEIPSTLIEKLNSNTKIVVLTGAGVSAESGIPTFRDAMDGLWGEFDPEEMASARGFRKNPKLVYDWYDSRHIRALKAEPNTAHTILADWERRFPNFHLITQNVDGLHTRSGSARVIEMHGNVHRMKCLNKGHPSEWISLNSGVPKCQQCGSMLRPDVVWFGENLDPANLKAISDAMDRCTLFFSVGTSGLVYPAAGLLEEAKNAGALTVSINPDPGAMGTADIFLKGKAGEVLKEIDSTLSCTSTSLFVD